MSDQGSVASSQQPVCCGCGGKAVHSYTSRCEDGKCVESHFITCRWCLAMVSGSTYNEAVQKWNRAMSGNRIRIHPVILKEME